MSIIFDINFLRDLARVNKHSYTNAAPFPHIVIDQVANERLAEECSKAFPSPNDSRWFSYPIEDITQKNKQVLWDISKMPHEVQSAVTALNSAPFLRFLEVLTGIPHLISDPFLYGGGMHQIRTDGMLEVHVDCDFNPRLQLYRRVTVLWYLSQWLPEYKGGLELWEGCKNNEEEYLIKCVKSIVPFFNRMVIFTNTESSYHGHPVPLRCPENLVRKSIATYYFSAEPDQSYSIYNHHKARFIPLPSVGLNPAMTLFRKQRARLDSVAVKGVY
ncbi:MAG: 2OG-Fe(II) oxygenase [Acidobacteriota bacterium]|nr:2OG-Fe(II) oxygenase [Acidobacteriota bacterium]